MSGLPDDFWEARFQEGQTPWERGGPNPAFLAWRRAELLAPCRILVPGAGRSPEPAALLSVGFDVVALDLADSAVSVQRGRLGASRAVQADVTSWLPDAPFDAVYDQTCLCALPPALWPAYEAQLRRWLRPGGRLLILFMQTGRDGGPPFDCPIPAMRALFSSWAWPGTLAEAVPHGLGTLEQPVVLVRAAMQAWTACCGRVGRGGPSKSIPTPSCTTVGSAHGRRPARRRGLGPSRRHRRPGTRRHHGPQLRRLSRAGGHNAQPRAVCLRLRHRRGGPTWKPYRPPSRPTGCRSGHALSAPWGDGKPSKPRPCCRTAPRCTRLGVSVGPC